MSFSNSYHFPSIAPVGALRTFCQQMKTHPMQVAMAVLLPVFCGACNAGPAAVAHPKSASVTIRDPKFAVVQVLRDPKEIKMVQDSFLRAKRAGDTSTRLRGATYKIDFADRWLVDLKSGDIGLLTKVVTEVYQLEARDLVALKGLLKPRAEP